VNLWIVLYYFPNLWRGSYEASSRVQESLVVFPGERFQLRGGKEIAYDCHGCVSWEFMVKDCITKKGKHLLTQPECRIS